MTTSITNGSVSAPIYEVKRGDSLWRIANRNNTTVADLKRLNNLRRDIIHPGQRLVLTDTAAPVIHEQKIDVEQVLPADVSVKEAETPDETPEVQAVQAAPVEQSAVKDGFDQITYTIQRGDNLWALARRFYCTEKEIMSLNGMRSNLIHEGRTLKIQPGTRTDTKYDPEKIAYSYLVTPKDLSREEPLAEIAARFSGEEPHQVITAADISAVNGLGSSPLKAGQHLWVTNVTIEGRSASWYGKDFHGKKMANGKNFDMNAVSCATRDLPLGARVTVLNSSNGRQVGNVPVWDRGPYVDKSSRAIDLSREIAKRLGMLETGVAPVRITIESLPKMPDLPLEA
jgi:rare lipoprotein A